MAGFFMVFKKCKCGESVGCMAGDGTEDGDLIEHQNCKLKDRFLPSQQSLNSGSGSGSYNGKEKEDPIRKD